ncbi:MAG: hypothetical protein B6D55_03845 [Candidatus Omnitrophica bacterium 4484_70.2]|nr:MAG: hypothetical protein B6D55_03845 [Candidatus Omnitrophica bacterium 4484_70.2]
MILSKLFLRFEFTKKLFQGVFVPFHFAKNKFTRRVNLSRFQWKEDDRQWANEFFSFCFSYGD